MRLRLLFGWSGLLLSATIQAQQVTFQHGNTLSALISNLYGGDGIQLANTGHQAHFGKTGDFQGFTESLQSVLQFHALVGSGRFVEVERDQTDRSLGPILAERGSTTGKGNLNMSLTYTFADYETIAGKDTLELILHHCLTPDCVGTGALPAFVNDAIHVQLHFRLKSQALVFSAVYGLTNRLDVGLVVPYVRNDSQVFTHAFIVVAPGSDPAIHRFDPSIETPDQYGTATAVGIGDAVARAKLRLAPYGGFDNAVMADLTFPTGDKANFLGNGRRSCGWPTSHRRTSRDSLRT